MRLNLRFQFPSFLFLDRYRFFFTPTFFFNKNVYFFPFSFNVSFFMMESLFSFFFLKIFLLLIPTSEIIVWWMCGVNQRVLDHGHDEMDQRISCIWGWNQNFFHHRKDECVMNSCIIILYYGYEVETRDY